MFLVTYKSSRQISPNDFETFSVNKLFNPDTTLAQLKQWKQETDRTTSILMSEIVVSEILPPAASNISTEPASIDLDVSPDEKAEF